VSRGVVGETMQRYHLFGQTVHITEVLESTAPIYRVHLSAATKESFDEERELARLRGIAREASATAADGGVASAGGCSIRTLHCRHGHRTESMFFRDLLTHT